MEEPIQDKPITGVPAVSTVSQPATSEKVSTPLLIANITLIGFVVSFGFMIYQTRQHPQIVEAKEKVVDMSAFNDIAIEANSVYIWDVAEQQVIYAKDAQVPRQLASLTKIMTAVTAMNILPRNTTITVNKDFLAEEGDSGLYVNEKWSFKNLLDFSLLVSSNDGMHSIASVAGAFMTDPNMQNPNYTLGLTDFISKMNDLASTTGLTTLHFNNETGLDQADGQPGGIGSAEDVAKLMAYALKNYPNLLEATKDQSEVISSLDKKHVAKNTDPVVAKIPNLIASKTGYTDTAGGNLVVAFDAGVNHPIIITVLDSTYDGRFLDMQKLASSTLEYLKENDY